MSFGIPWEGFEEHAHDALEFFNSFEWFEWLNGMSYHISCMFVGVKGRGGKES